MDKKILRDVRLQVAINLATVKHPTAEQILILYEICKLDPVIRNILEFYGGESL